MLKVAAVPIVCSALAAAWYLAGEEAPTPVEIDAVHSIDYAKAGCEMAEAQWQRDGAEIGRIGCDAVPGCTANLREKSLCAMGSETAAMLYISGLSTRFAADRACKGVTVFVARKGSSSIALKTPLLAEPHSALLIDFVPGNERHGWGLVDPGGALVGMGQGDPSAITETVCNIVEKRGADVRY